MKKNQQTGPAKRTVKKLLALLICGLLILPVHGTWQHNSSVTLTLRNSSLKDALQHLQENTDLNIVYSDQLLRNRARITYLRLNKEPVKDALTKVLAGSGLTFRMEGNNAIIYELPQQRTISGVVSDQETGETIPGVSVSTKLSGRNTSTDGQGAFSIAVHDGDVLTFRMLGYEEKSINAATGPMQVQLMPETSALNEVVVVGYGTQRRINLTGSVSSIKAEDFASRPVTSVNQAMQGQMPGVTVVTTSGEPGRNRSSIRIRGIGTLNDASPLVVIDGIPGGDMSILNPEDIESVSVLKDAASASIYGVRGANGVILVTTKKGRADAEGKADIGYNGYFGWQTATALPELANSYEYMELMNEALVNARSNPAWTDEQIAIARAGSDPNYYANTNWVDEIYKSGAPQQSHNLTLNGGMGESNYYLAYGYLNQGGMITGDNFNSHRHNVRLRFNTRVFDRLSLDGNVGYVDRMYESSSEILAEDGGVLGSGGPLNAALAISPLVPVRFTTGGWGYHGGQRNPVAMTTAAGTDNFASQEFTGNLQATLRLLDGLNLRGQYAQVRYHTRRNIFQKTVDYIDPFGNLVYQNNVPNRLQARSFTNRYQTMLGMLEYEKTFANAHLVKAMVAISQEDQISNDINASRTHFPVESVPSLNVGTENQLNSNPADQWALQSFFGRINYAYKDRYMLEGNFRRDGSSRFDPSLRWEWFSSVSAGWVFSEEPFFAGLKDIVNLGKVRFAIGTQGNDKVRSGGSLMNYGYMGFLQSRTTMPIGNVNTLAFWQPNVANKLLTWESVIKRDIGVDLSLLNNRLNITADYYINKTNDILLDVPLPDVLGANFPAQNAGQVENRGWDLQIGWRSAINELSYGVTGNLSDVKNKVTNYGGAPPIISDRIRRIGDPIDSFYGLVADRIAQEADFEYNPVTGAYIPRFPHIAGDPLGPGDIIYKVLTPTTDPSKPYDVNDPDREYISLDKDRQVIGNAIPRYTFGFRGDLAWRGIDFSFFLQGVGKINGLLENQARHAFINQSTMPHKTHLNRWTPENPNATYPRLVYNQTYNTRLSTFWIEDASYLRLKNVQIGYTVPANAFRVPALQKLRIYASADNLLTFSDFYNGFDPEVPVSRGGWYPQMRTFIMGISANIK